MMREKELRAAMDRFYADKDRVISERLLAELAGISLDTLKDVFKLRRTMLTPTTQLRLERALKHIERGEVAVMQDGMKRRSIQYRKKGEEKPAFRKTTRLTFRNGRIGLKVGPENANCYTAPTFKDEWED
jgi:hypothetical protein